jgi:aryl-alcohol dehydrogenase-like predicted oxidoreductase
MSKKKSSPPLHPHTSAVNRRNFLAQSSLLTAGLLSVGSALGNGVAAGTGSRKPAARTTLATRKLGELEVSALGLGCMSMTSGSYNPVRPRDEMVRVIRGAVERGVTFFDTAEVYGPFSNEEYVGEALRPVRDAVVIASKFGFNFDAGARAGRKANPAYLRERVEGMLRRLQTDRIDLLYLHRVDPEVPVEDVAGLVGDLIREGKARHFGLSEVAPDTLRRAHAVQPVAAVQSEYSLVQRVPENGVLDTCEELGVGFVPWGSLCRGFLTDKFNEWSRFAPDSRLSEVPYFTPEALAANYALIDLVRAWGLRKNASPAQLSLAWLLAERPFIVPIPGTTKLHHLEEDLGALDVSFTPEELSQFREDFSRIELVGVRAPQTALIDQ